MWRAVSWRAAAVCVVTLASVSACGQASSLDAQQSEAISTEVTSSTLPETSTTAPPQTQAPLDRQFTKDAIDRPTTTAPTTSSSSSTTQRVITNRSPATTVASSGGGSVAIYVGMLGSLGVDQQVVAPVGEVPAPQANIMPLTGLAGAPPNRPALIVKIDNSSRARPQAGLNQADIVVEEEVEGGITRLAAVFHSNDSTLGPIRSARTTDIGVINGFGSPLLLYSGANSVTDALVRAQPAVQNRSAATTSGYWRDSSRRAPSNLYSDTATHWASAAGGAPPPQFHYVDNAGGQSGQPTAAFQVNYRSSTARWDWDGNQWLRTQGGSAHLVPSGERVSAANVIVVETQKISTGMVDSSGADVPEFVFVGTGKATVFTAGVRIEGTWTKPTLSSVATFQDDSGSTIYLNRGRTWIEIVQADAGMLSLG